MKHELGSGVWVRCPDREVCRRRALLREGPTLPEEMDVKTNRCINMQSVQVMKILELAKQCLAFFTGVQSYVVKA